MRDERYASDGRARIFGRSDIESGYLDGFWGFCSKFRPNIHSRSIGIRKSSLVRPNITLVWRVSNFPRSCGGHASPSPNPLASSPVRRRVAAPYGYTLEDSTRFAPAGASKETAYAHHLNRPARRCRRTAGARHYLPRLCRRALRDRTRARLGRLRASPHRLGRSPAVPGVRRRKQGLCHWL